MSHRQGNVRMTGSRVPLAAGLPLAPATITYTQRGT